MSELRKKILTRNGHRTFVKKVIGSLEGLLQADIDENRSKLESSKIALEKQQKEIEALDSQIADLLEADAIEKEILEKCDFDAALQEAVCSITSHLTNFQSPGIYKSTGQSSLKVRTIRPVSTIHLNHNNQ